VRLLVALTTLSACGCQSGLRPIFEPLYPAIEWPPAPMLPKIRYVGEIRSSADLKPRRGLLEGLGETLVGKKTPETLYGPRAALSLADEGRLWIADPGARCLHLFDMRHRRYAKVTRAGNMPFLSPVGLCRGPEGSIFVCDAELSAVYRLSDKTGAIISEVQLPQIVERPVALHFDPATRELFVVDAKRHDIKVLAPDGSLVRVIGQRGSGPGEFNFPLAIAGDGDMVWVADTGNHRIQALTRAGEFVTMFGQNGDAPGDMALPKGIATDGNGHIYVVDGRFENVQIFDRLGRLLLFFGQEGRGPGEFWLPSGISIDSEGRIWICDLYNRRIQVFDYVGPVPAVESAPGRTGQRAYHGT
jgi:sugar lactone lactonase YvrE